MLQGPRLNREWFRDLREAKVLIETWRQFYNRRPHSALRYRPPAVFTAQSRMIESQLTG